MSRLKIHMTLIFILMAHPLFIKCCINSALLLAVRWKQTRKQKSMGRDFSEHTVVHSTPKCAKLRLPVVVCHTVDLVVHIDGEGYTIQALIADATSETPWVVRLAHGLQDLQRTPRTPLTTTLPETQWVL